MQLDPKKGVELILRAQQKILEDNSQDRYYDKLQKMSFVELCKEIGGDKLTPCITSLERLKHYLIFATDYSKVAFDSEESKKKRAELVLTREHLILIILHRRMNPHAWWIPTGAMEALMREMTRILNGEGRNIGLFGGNGGGKSVGWINLCLGLLLPDIYNPWIAAWGLVHNKRKWANMEGEWNTLQVGLMLPSTAMNTVLFPALRKWAPKGSWVAMQEGKNRDWVVRFKDGGLIYIFTTNQTQSQFAGGTLDAFFTSEPFPVRMLAEMRARLRGIGFMFHDIMPDYDPDAMKLSSMLHSMSARETILVNWHKDVSCSTCGIRGFKPHHVVEQEKIDCPPEYRAARIEGLPLHNIGKIFPELKPEIHQLSEQKIIELVRDMGGTFGVGCDPQDALPNYVQWWVVLPNNVRICVDEWPRWNPKYVPSYSTDWKVRAMEDCMMPFHKMTKDWADDPAKFVWVVWNRSWEVIQKFTGGFDQHGYPINRKVNPCVLWYFMDPRGASATSAGGTSKDIKYVEQVNRIGAPYKIKFIGKQAKGGLMTRNQFFKALLSGIEFEELERAEREGGEINYSQSPLIYFSELAQNTFNCFMQSYYEPEVVRGATTGKLTPYPDKDFKHGTDAAAYLLQQPAFVYTPTESIPKYLWYNKRAREEYHNTLLSERQQDHSNSIWKLL
jgi:hypothetical protein